MENKQYIATYSFLHNLCETCTPSIQMYTVNPFNFVSIKACEFFSRPSNLTFLMLQVLRNAYLHPFNFADF